jgi:hypothetical protein
VSNRVEALVKAIRGLPRTLDNGFIYIATKRHFIYTLLKDIVDHPASDTVDHLYSQWMNTIPASDTMTIQQ